MVYVDASVILRFVLAQPDRLEELKGMTPRLTSTLTEVECLRAIDCARIRADLTDDEYAFKRREVYRQLRMMHRVNAVRSLLKRAGEPFPMTLKALDAIHIASALQVRDRRDEALVFATHDRQVGRAAAALDFRVIGC